MGCHFQGIFPSQGLSLHFLHLCIGRQILYQWATWEDPTNSSILSSIIIIDILLSYSIIVVVILDYDSIIIIIDSSIIITIKFTTRGSLSFLSCRDQQAPKLWLLFCIPCYIIIYFILYNSFAGDKCWKVYFHLSSIQSVSCVPLLVTPWTAANQASLSITKFIPEFI